MVWSRFHSACHHFNRHNTSSEGKIHGCNLCKGSVFLKSNNKLLLNKIVLNCQWCILNKSSDCCTFNLSTSVRVLWKYMSRKVTDICKLFIHPKIWILNNWNLCQTSCFYQKTKPHLIIRSFVICGVLQIFVNCEFVFNWIGALLVRYFSMRKADNTVIIRIIL